MGIILHRRWHSGSHLAQAKAWGGHFSILAQLLAPLSRSRAPQHNRPPLPQGARSPLVTLPASPIAVEGRRIPRVKVKFETFPRGPSPPARVLLLTLPRVLYSGHGPNRAAGPPRQPRFPNPPANCEKNSFFAELIELIRSFWQCTKIIHSSSFLFSVFKPRPTRETRPSRGSPRVRESSRRRERAEKKVVVAPANQDRLPQ